MTELSKCLSVTIVGCLSFLGKADADNWAHWRGPTGNGIAHSATPPTRWSATDNVQWKAEIPGKGSGSPVIWEDKVFVVTAAPVDGANTAAAGTNAPRRQRPPGRGRRRGGPSGPLPELGFQLLCFNRAKGTVMWQKTATVATPHQGTHQTNGFASASPCTDGVNVYAHFGSRGLFCYSMEGRLIWKRDDFGKMNTRNSFGEGSSPTLEGDKIIVPWDHEGQSYLFALDKSSGETIWRVERDEPSCWATPLVVEHQGSKQIIMNGQNYARAYDLETGAEIWRCSGQTVRPAASAVSDQGLVFLGSGFRGAYLGAFRLDGTQDIQGSQHVVWEMHRDTPDIASPLLSDGRLYFFNKRRGQLSCVDAATGAPFYTSIRIPELAEIYASPIAAGGHIYLTDRNGTTVVIEDAEKLRVVATNSVEETVDATPAPVDRELFIRGERHLFCIAG